MNDKCLRAKNRCLLREYYIKGMIAERLQNRQEGSYGVKKLKEQQK